MALLTFLWGRGIKRVLSGLVLEEEMPGQMRVAGFKGEFEWGPCLRLMRMVFSFAMVWPLVVSRGQFFYPEIFERR